MEKLSFEQAKAQYPHRFTCDHVPQWALKPIEHGKYYAPHFASDREWYEKTEFPPHQFTIGKDESCYSSGQTWPLGHWLDKPFDVQRYTYPFS